MKRFILTAAIAVTGLSAVQAQDANDTFIKIENENIFSQCFEICDTNKDGIVTYAEAAAATKLGLDRGGRSNIIENYDFLRYFPNLEMLSIGNTTLEEIDLHELKNLKLVNVSNAPWLKKLIIGCESAPEITGQNPTREAIKQEVWVEDPVVSRLHNEGYNFVEPIHQDGDTYYIVSRNFEARAYSDDFGLWHNGTLEVPCKYNYDNLRSNFFTVEVKELGDANNQHEHPANCRCLLHQKKELQMMTDVPEVPNMNIITFKDEAIRDFCTNWLKTVDTNKDKIVTLEEAAAAKNLSLMNFKSFMRTIKDYDDLKYFPNLEYFHAGMSYAETIDLSACKKLKEIDLSDCRMLKTIVLAKGCQPTIKYPVAYKGEKAKVEYR